MSTVNVNSNLQPTLQPNGGSGELFPQWLSNLGSSQALNQSAMQYNPRPKFAANRGTLGNPSLAGGGNALRSGMAPVTWAMPQWQDLLANAQQRLNLQQAASGQALQGMQLGQQGQLANQGMGMGVLSQLLSGIMGGQNG